jgi:hypothetical protein
MKQTSRSARDVGGLLAAICALAIITVTLGALAVRAENPVPAQTPSAAQTPAPARSAHFYAHAESHTDTYKLVNGSDAQGYVFTRYRAGEHGRARRWTSPASKTIRTFVTLAFATGGVWKTVNNGTTFTPIFDTYSRGSIGDVAISSSNPDIVWVGTGEANNRQSSSFGDRHL